MCLPAQSANQKLKQKVQTQYDDGMQDLSALNMTQLEALFQQ